MLLIDEQDHESYYLYSASTSTWGELFTHWANHLENPHRGAFSFLAPVATYFKGLQSGKTSLADLEGQFNPYLEVPPGDVRVSLPVGRGSFKELDGRTDPKIELLVRAYNKDNHGEVPFSLIQACRNTGENWNISFKQIPNQIPFQDRHLIHRPKNHDVIIKDALEEYHQSNK
ncbi:hypothetical protein CL622_03250 [archaeon]|nr:hypothetical protein [archaeon]